MDNQRIDLGYNGGATAKPLGSVWRGMCKIPSRKIDINLAAHLSSKASSIISEVVTKMPDSLCLEIFARRDVWPTCFKNVPPTEFSIDLFFFSEGRDKNVLDSLLSDAISTDFALKAKIGELELLIFTSFLLPERLQRFHGKFYFCGLFMGQGAAFYHKSDSDVRGMPCLSSNSGYIRRSERKDGPNPIHTPSEHSALKKHSGQSERRGRRLDDAWSHAKLLDELRQKTECKYCGFVSEHGGISRLKAHLAGETLRLPGCLKVSPEIKIAMANWYSEWVKNTKALWVKGIQGTSSPVNPIKRRAQEDGWEHVLRLDERGYQTKCMYCGFVSKRGGIRRMKVHLAGGDPTKHLECCPDVPPDVKTMISEVVSKSKKKTKDTKKETVEMELQGNSVLQKPFCSEDKKISEAHWTHGQSGVLQDTLEEVKNTNLKASLRKLIDKKNAEMQKMQYEIQSLESQLSSLP